MSGPVDVGQTYRYRYTVRDAAGVPANAGTVTVTITLPDGTTATPGVVNSATGVYDIAYTTVQSGLHSLYGSATGGVLGTEFDKWEDAFTVERAGQMIVGVDEASSHLRAQGIITSDADREQLRRFCMGSSKALARECGRVLTRRTVTEVHDGGRPQLILRQTPVASITSITVSGTLLAATAYRLANPMTGIVEAGSSWSRSLFGWGYGNVAVVYVAGLAAMNTVEADELLDVARTAALNLVQSMWQSSQQAFHPGLDESSVEAFAQAALPGLSQIPGYDSLRAAAVA